MSPNSVFSRASDILRGDPAIAHRFGDDIKVRCVAAGVGRTYLVLDPVRWLAHVFFGALAHSRSHSDCLFNMRYSVDSAVALARACCGCYLTHCDCDCLQTYGEDLGGRREGRRFHVPDYQYERDGVQYTRFVAASPCPRFLRPSSR